MQDILTLYTADERRYASMPGMRRENTGRLVRLINEAETDKRCFVLFSDLDEETADAAIAEQVADFAASGRTLEWVVYAGDRPADLDERLVARGFVEGETYPVLVAEIAGLRERLAGTPAADVRRVLDPAELETVRALLAEVWGKEFEWLVARMTRLLAADYAAVYMAYVGGKPVSVAWLSMPEGSRFAVLNAGSTLEAYRGRGLYRALLAERAREAQARGYQYLTISAGDMSRPIVERLGFQVLTEAREFVWEPPRGEEKA